MRFIHVANISGKSRLSRYYDSHVSPHERYTQALEVTKIALERLQRPKPSLLSSIFEFNGMKIVYRQFASLIFLAGLDEDENEFSALEFLQLFVEILQFYFGNVCEMDIIFNLDRVYMILDEVVNSSGQIIETNKLLVCQAVEQK